MPSTSSIAREIHLVRRPSERLRATDLALTTVTLPHIEEGQFLIRNELVGLDPVRRVFFADGTAPLGKGLFGFAIGKVVESLNPNFPVGSTVTHNAGLRDLAVSNGYDVRTILPSADPLEWHADALGVGGFFAYVGLIEIGRLRPGETVFVTSAAGSVGSVVSQVARIMGCRVIGSVGSAEKCHWLRETAGIDAAINYRDGNVAEALRAVAPEGIDLFFDNVGGEQLDDALDVMGRGSRVVIAGMVSAYDMLDPLSERHGGWTKKMLTSQVSMQSFNAFDYSQLWPKFQHSVGKWLRTGEIRSQINIIDGLDAIPGAFVDLLNGARHGKTLIRVN